MKELNIHQIHERCLKIAIELDRICTKHEIPYYMLGGTMLGAIRHKGFIPWDDDMDFGVPYEHFERLIRMLRIELQEPYRCVTFEDSKGLIFPYFKIEDTTTGMAEPFAQEITDDSIGINIDVFPLFLCKENDPAIKKARRLIDISGYIFVPTMHDSMIRRVVKKTLQFLCPFNASWFCRKSLSIAQNIHKGEKLANIYGRWREKESIPIDWYGTSIRYKFEDCSFVGIEKYDKYLKQMYGDYMEIPAKENRIVHSGGIYLR